MMMVSRALVHEGCDHLHMFFHSSSLRPGLNPFSRTQADVDALYARRERERERESYLEALDRITGIRFCTVSEAARPYRPALRDP